jgi:26S proteasome regulatory subunit T3
MGDVAVESPGNNVTPLPKPAALDALASLDSLEGTGADGNDEYANLKRLQRHLELVMTRMPWSFPTLLTPPTDTFSCRRNTSRMSKGKPSQNALGSGTRLLTSVVEYRSLKRELVRAQEEIKRIQSVPLVIGQFMEAIDQKYARP